MEEVLGAHTDSRAFEAFLRGWRTVLARRVAETVTTLAQIPGVCGLVLAGSLGRGEGWPLSDVDLLPIYDDNRVEAAAAEVERRRTEPLERWAREGWWSGIDVGRLFFRLGEVVDVPDKAGDAVLARLSDDRWYHSPDKGYRGTAVYDPTGRAARLVRYFTSVRFHPDVVRLRLTREQGEVERAWRRLEAALASQDLLVATRALLAAVHWLRIWQLERWGERDNSLGRLGTRFERAARAHGRADLIDQINALTDLDDPTAEQRLAVAPWWVRERHDRSWRARQHVREEVTRAEDLRDVLRVATQYAIREVAGPPFPPWLASPADLATLDARQEQLLALTRQVLDQSLEPRDSV